jgi:hypothetical protein
MGEVGSLQLGLPEVGPQQLGMGEVGTLHLGPAKVGLLQLGPAEVGPFEIGQLEIGPLQLGLPEDGFVPTQVDPGQVRPEVLHATLVLRIQPPLVIHQDELQLLVRNLPKFGFGGGSLRVGVSCVVHPDPRARSGVRLTVACHLAT